MVHEGMLVADVTSKKLSLGSNTNATRSIQKAILQAVRNEPAGISVKDLRKSLDETSEIDRAEERLIEQGLHYSREQQQSLRSFPSWLFGSLFVFGIIKVFVGVDRDKPVAFLAIFSVITFAVFFLIRKWMPTRTQRGDQALARMFDEYDALKATASTHTSALSSSDAMLALCLFGPTLFSTGPVADYALLSRPPREGGSGCGGSSCGSSSGCGGGDGGGGGGDGGGGGCGGCGGGGD